jgi:hypothetical protein
VARDLPAGTIAFIRRYIHSFEELEILLLLRESPFRPWTASQVYDAIRSNLQSIERRLEKLSAQQLLASAVQDKILQYRYQPANAELAGLVDELAAAYKEHRVVVIEHIFAEPLSPIQSFADSFRIRRNEKNG